jgi:aerobic C4-dicarboxylate transport protein
LSPAWRHGYVHPEPAAMKPLGDGFIKIIRMLIALIIFCTRCTGSSMTDLASRPRRARRCSTSSLTTLALAPADRGEPLGLAPALTSTPPRIDTSAIDLARIATAGRRPVPAAHRPCRRRVAEGEILQVLFISVLSPRADDGGSRGAARRCDRDPVAVFQIVGWS